MKTTSILLILAVLCGCSPLMEVSRPYPIDMSQFSVGETRTLMVAELGTPTETLKDWGESCDVYKIYTHGHGTGERVAIASGEVVADIGTLCLAELFLTPAEIATKTSRYTVLVCYGVDNKVASIRESGNPTPN